jgi:hypothetical protein
MSGIYEQMAGKGLCAYPGGEQSVRVILEALEFIAGSRVSERPRGMSEATEG